MNDPPAQVRPPLRWRLLRAARRLGWAVEGRLRVPAAFVTGSVGKTTTCRMTAAILMAAGHRVGLTTTTGCSVAERPLRSGDSASARWAALVTGQPDCDVAVLEMARGGILNEGIPFTGCDVGAVLNVLDNHLGSDGIETRAQLAAVKGLVVEKARGLAVLNADDPLVLAMQDRTKAREVCLVSRRPESAAVIAHRAAGGLACFLDPEPHDRGGTLRLVRGTSGIAALAAADIPATFGGRFAPAVTNALFALAIGHGLGVGAATMQAALADFRSDKADNPGRMNLHHDLPVPLLTTKTGSAFEARSLAEFIRVFPVTGRRLLVICAMGNRADAVLETLGAACAGSFDHHVCCDWEDRRGRPPGAAAALIARGLAAAGVPPAAIEVEPDHDRAILRGLALAGPDDLLVVSSMSAGRAPGIIRAASAVGPAPGC